MWGSTITCEATYEAAIVIVFSTLKLYEDHNKMFFFTGTYGDLYIKLSGINEGTINTNI
jgi:hypothetical protein